VKLAQVT